MGGSYIGVVTATAFQTLGRLVGDSAIATILIFALPTLIGTPLIAPAIERRLAMPPDAPPATGAEGRASEAIVA